ncbi:hypothetical protein [Robertmurraya sp. P23]|uniref:hypothetical protein n=1 Tax=Robertmurraya sp. P23 TaxID=3436931 RepID=UPI003D9960ED
MVAIILLILVIAAVVSQLSKSKKKAWIGMKTTRLLLLGYVGLLILLAGASLLLPMNSTSLKVMSEEEVEQSMKLQDQVMNEAFRGTFEEENGLDVVEKWTFPFTSDELGITPINDYSVQVFIEKSPDIGNEIQVTHYAGKTIVNGMDLTEKRGAVNIEMQGNQLEIKNPSHVGIKLAEISNGFPFQQFSAEGVEWFSNSSYGNIGMDVLYIKAPIGLKIEGEALYVN